MSDFFPGNPANYVLGRAEEKPARRHAPQKPKPKVIPLSFEERLLRDIRDRMAVIKPQIDEIPRLTEALEALKKLR